MKVSVYNWENKKAGEVELPEGVFGVPWKPKVVAQVVDAQLANRREPWAHAKTRAEVRGGGRKPWRQKGTGRARHGSIRSPLWRGGGKAHGPLAERIYTKKVNKKMRRLALVSVLSKKMGDGEVKIMEKLAVELPKTKELALRLRGFAGAGARVKKLDIVLIPEKTDVPLSRAAANLGKTKVLHPGALNVYDLLNYRHVLIARNALPIIERHYQIKK